MVITCLPGESGERYLGCGDTPVLDKIMDTSFSTKSSAIESLPGASGGLLPSAALGTSGEEAG